MSPILLVSVIDFQMFPTLDNAHDGVAFFFQTFPNFWSNCVGMDIFLTDTLIHSFMEGSLSTLLPLPMPWLLMFLVLLFFCCFFFFLLLFKKNFFFFNFFFSSCMAGHEMRINFSCVVPSVF